MSPLPVVAAAGGVLWRPRTGGDDIDVALVHRPRYDDWSHPKGKLLPDEQPLLGAVREVEEETGFRPVVGRSLPGLTYRTNAGGRPAQKVVSYWSMCAAGGAFVPNSEVDEMAWLTPEEARRRLTHPHDREPLDALLAAPARTVALLLVRHGRAGSRSQWSGDDRLRPLDPTGERQARGLVELAPHFAPTRVLSADLTRCEQTVRPLAEQLGVPVELEPELTDDAAARDLDRAVGQLRSLAAAGASTVVCSQGGLIPAAVRALAARDHIDLDGVSARKGSGWALSFAAAAAPAAAAAAAGAPAAAVDGGPVDPGTAGGSAVDGGPPGGRGVRLVGADYFTPVRRT